MASHLYNNIFVQQYIGKDGRPSHDDKFTPTIYKISEPSE